MLIVCEEQKQTHNRPEVKLFQLFVKFCDIHTRPDGSLSCFCRGSQYKSCDARVQGGWLDIGDFKYEPYRVFHNRASWANSGSNLGLNLPYF